MRSLHVAVIVPALTAITFAGTALVGAGTAQSPPVPAPDTGARWPQFRGPNGAGIATGNTLPPVEFSASRNMLWRTVLPAGHSSPAVWGDRIFLTAFDKDRKVLEVIALNQSTGSILWRRGVPAEQIETVHQLSSPATATPAVDGDSVFAYFGSYGLVAYDFAGEQRWTLPLPTVQVPFGSGTSPVVAGDRVILNRHEPKDPFLVAIDRKSGTIIWKQTHEVPSGQPIAFGSHSTPLVVGDQIVIHGPTRVQAFDLATGAPRWWVAASTSGTSTPVSDGNTVYVATWSPFGESDQVAPLPDYATMVKRHDANGDGLLAREEIPADLAIFSRPETPNVPGAAMFVRGSFNRFDANKDGALAQGEWEAGLATVTKLTVEHGLLAVRTGGSGDVTTTHVRWKEKTSIPEVPSPLAYRGRVYMIRNGGILTSLDAASGKIVYRARVGAPGPYYASPAVAGDRMFVASGDGIVSVVGIADAMNVLARNDLGEPVFASPAICDGVLYIRTASALMAFGGK